MKSDEVTEVIRFIVTPHSSWDDEWTTRSLLHTRKRINYT